MNKITLLVGLMLLIGGFAWAEPVSMPSATVTGTIGKPNDAKVAATLGHNGVLFIRSEARWKEFADRLGAAIPINAEIPKFDFNKQSVVLIYADARRPADTFKVAKSDLTANPPQLRVMLDWNNGLEKGLEDRSTKLILAVIPATPTVNVTVSSVPLNADYLSIVTEFSATLGGKDGGDIVDGLQASITSKDATIKPSDDILIDFELHLANMPDAHPEQFGSLSKSVYVWDAVFSGGYQNYSYLVTSPDGKIRRLQRPAQIFQRNISRTIEITADKPYQLLEDSSENTAKSLKALGLDTSTPGTYTITGLYKELASVKTTREGKKTSLWGGSIASNTITVEVKK